MDNDSNLSPIVKIDKVKKISKKSLYKNITTKKYKKEKSNQ